MSESDGSTSSGGMTYRRLYRSQRQKVIAGICGGVAEYFNVDVVIVRVLWILFTLMGGAGILAYILCWIIVPPRENASDDPSPRDSSGLIIGVILLVIGLAALFGWASWGFYWLPMGFHWTVFPFFTIVLALGLLIGWVLSRSSQASPPPGSLSKTNSSVRNSSQTDRENNHQWESPKRAYRSRNLRVIAGVCGGLGQYFNLDPTIVRILWILFALASMGLAVLLYIILIFVLPEKPY
jgi:phage shock protein PspC (stress-responsive transcriptional regulator)